MLLSKQKLQKITFASLPRKTFSLSTYFPKGTHYFYAYPAGEASGFFNKVPPKVEELVAARTLSCAGSKVSVIKFAATHSSVVGEDIVDALGLPQLKDAKVTVLPKEINASLQGKARNTAIKQALKKNVKPGSLVMAQPYTDKAIEHLYQIPTRITTWLNDKSNMEQYISANFLPKRYGVFASGRQFVEHYNDITLPCVVKVSSSSSGDGVYICRKPLELEKAMEELSDISGTILVEQFIEVKKNFGIHFGIPHDRKKTIDIIGVNEQLTSESGEFLGGIIEASEFPEELAPIERYLREDILKKVRAMGWYGIGCVDVLCDKDNRLYLIDCNFRITGMSAYHFLISNNKIKAPMISFGGEFTGTREELEEKLFPYADRHSNTQMAQIIALTRYDNVWSFNAALSFESHSQLKERIKLLTRAGVRSPALEQVLNYFGETLR